LALPTTLNALAGFSGTSLGGSILDAASATCPYVRVLPPGPLMTPFSAFSVEASARRKGVGSILFKNLIAEAHARGYRALRITTGAQNEPMRALANKFGAKLTFHHGESTGSIDLAQHNRPTPAPVPAASVAPLDAASAIVDFNRAYWRLVMQMYGWSRAA